ncbi:hypothetical protein, partial [Chryseobacterium sp.]
MDDNAALIQRINQMTNLFTSPLEAIKLASAVAKRDIIASWSEVVGDIKQGGTQLRQNIKKSFDSAILSLKDLPSNITSGIKNIYGDFKNSITTGYSNVKNFAKMALGVIPRPA